MKLFGLTLLTAMVLTGCQTTGLERSASAAGDACISVPMPNFKIQAMPKGLKPELAKFMGIWHGDWGGEFPSCLVVTHVDESGAADIVYGWSGGHRTFSTTIDGNTIRFGEANGRLVCTLSGDNEVNGVYTTPSGKQYITMRNFPAT
ncbi:MAG: hypothetical protein OSB82_22385 [Alphaproteobacteria bacterium]|nr:hypothetical protein [Alphaproteobacteria bacterium]